MRNKTHIQKTLKEIESIWSQYPELRLSQLLLNACCMNTSDFDIYNVEDEKIISNLKEFNKRVKPVNV